MVDNIKFQKVMSSGYLGTSTETNRSTSVFETWVFVKCVHNEWFHVSWQIMVVNKSKYELCQPILQHTAPLFLMFTSFLSNVSFVSAEYFTQSVCSLHTDRLAKHLFSSKQHRQNLIMCLANEFPGWFHKAEENTIFI